jgi:hypothetical protein
MSCLRRCRAGPSAFSETARQPPGTAIQVAPPGDGPPSGRDMQLAAPPISSSGCAPNGPRDRWITDKSVTRVERSWAGLRSLAPDRTPVVGYDPQQEGLFWLAGQHDRPDPHAP